MTQERSDKATSFAALKGRVAKLTLLSYLAPLVAGALVSLALFLSLPAVLMSRAALSALLGFGVTCGLAYVRERWSRLGVSPKYHVYIRHDKSGEWGWYPPDLHPRLPLKKLGFTVKTFEKHHREVEVEGVIPGTDVKVKVVFAWEPDVAALPDYFTEMEGTTTRLKEAAFKAALAEAARLPELPTEAIPVPPPAKKGIIVSRCSARFRKPPEPPPRPDEEWMTSSGTLTVGSEIQTGIPAYLYIHRELVAHVQIIGASRFGKSKLMEYAARQLAYWGTEGLCLIDPNQQLYAAMLKWCAYQGITDKIHFLDPSDERSQVGFNPFRISGPKTPARISSLANRLLATTLKALGYSGGEAIQAERILSCLYYMIIEQDLPLTDLSAFLYPRLFDRRDEILARCKSQTVHDEWDMLTAGKSTSAYVNMMQSSGNRLFKVIADEGVQRILSNPLRIDLKQITERGERLFINLKDGPTFSEQSRDVIGTFLVDEVWSAVSSRDDEQARRLPRFNFAIDEFHNFASPQFAKMLKEGAKYRLHFWLINHSQDDLEADVVRALRACYTRIIFGRTAKKDVVNILEGSKPMTRYKHEWDNRKRDAATTTSADLGQDVETALHLVKREFLLTRVGEENVVCRTDDVKDFPVSPAARRAYLEALTRTDDELKREQIARLVRIVRLAFGLSNSPKPAEPLHYQGDAAREPATPLQPQQTKEDVEPDDFYY